ncbi:MAG TPA: FecR domain-containing protein [Candidatus Methylacidiphilales bacterium]
MRCALVGLASTFAGPLPLSAQTMQGQAVPPPTQAPQTPQQAAQVPPRNQLAQGHMYPKNLAQQLLGARIRVNQSAGIRMLNGFPPPATAAGTLDVSTLLSTSFDGLELAPGFHSITITLAKPVPVNRVSFVNMDATGTYNVLIGITDPQLQPTPPTKQENAISGPSAVNYAVFQPQMAQFVQIEFRIVKPGRIARMGVYGLASALDFAVRVKDDVAGTGGAPAPDNGGGLASTGKDGNAGVKAPGGAPSVPPTKNVDVDMAGLSSGGRVARVSSGGKGADPNQMIADAIGSPYTFNSNDPAPTVDLDFKQPRNVSGANVVLAGPPARVELIKTSPPPPPAAASSGIATVTRADGVVEILSIDGTGQVPAKSGDVLLPGRVIRTGFNSNAELDIDGKSILRVGPNSNVTLRLGTASGAEVSVLRGTVLWQVYAPGGGGRLITPTSVATISGTTIIAEVKLNGGSSVSLLETSRADGVQVSSTATGEKYTLHPGEATSVGGNGGALAVQPFIIQKAWDQSPVGASAGPLRNGVDQVFVPGGVVPTPQESGEVLATTTTKGGLSNVKLDFNGQSLSGVRIRVTPLPGAPAGTPVTIVGLSVTGQYQVQNLDYAYQGRSVAALAASEAAAGPSGVGSGSSTTLPTASGTGAAPGSPAAPGAGAATATTTPGVGTGAGGTTTTAALAPGTLGNLPDAAASTAASTSGGTDADGRLIAQVAEDNSGTPSEQIRAATIPQPPVYTEPVLIFGGFLDPLNQNFSLPTNFRDIVLPAQSQ